MKSRYMHFFLALAFGIGATPMLLAQKGYFGQQTQQGAWQEGAVSNSSPVLTVEGQKPVEINLTESARTR